MINQTIYLSGLARHLLYPMQCHLNGVQINKVHEFLADSSGETSHAIQDRDTLDAANMLFIPLF